MGTSHFFQNGPKLEGRRPQTWFGSSDLWKWSKFHPKSHLTTHFRSWGISFDQEWLYITESITPVYFLTYLGLFSVSQGANLVQNSQKLSKDGQKCPKSSWCHLLWSWKNFQGRKNLCMSETGTPLYFPMVLWAFRYLPGCKYGQK